MQRYRRMLDFFWIIIVLLFLFPVMKYTMRSETDGDCVSTQGPLFTGRSSLDSLVAQASGKTMIVNFWATWCTPCVGELPHIDQVYNSLQGEVEAVAVDIGDPRLETLLQFREDFILSIPVVWLNSDESSALKDQWDLPEMLPVTVILDERGEEIARFSGARDREFFLQAVSGRLQPTVDTTVTEDLQLHVNVVGSRTDSLTQLLYDVSVELAGEGAVDVYHPELPEDSLIMEDLHLPFTDFSYAQPCVGSACGRLARSPEDLHTVVESLSN
jgi:thiol-disulfide isomerase/thioredoxin